MKRLESRQKALIACLSCLTVVFATMLLAMSLSRKELTKEAFKTASVETEAARWTINAVFVTTEWVLNSVLTAISDIDSVGCHDGEIEYRRVIRKEAVENLDANAIMDMLKSFIEYNSEMYSCILIFEPGVVRNFPEGMAMAAFSDSRPGEDLLKKHDIYNSALYRKVAESGRTQYEVAQLNLDSKNVRACTIGMPIFDSTGKIVGQCWSDTKLDRLSKYLSDFKLENDYALAILLPDGTIMSSADSLYQGKSLYTALKEGYPEYFPIHWYEKITTVLSEGGNVRGEFSSDIKGDSIETYYNTVKNTEFLLVIVKSKLGVLRMSVKLHDRMLCIFVIAYLLLAAFLFYLYYAFRRENRDRSRMQNDLELAYNIQLRLLPPNPSEEDESVDVYGFLQPAKSVGGDMYGFFIKNGKLHFCIGDVSGKGVSAALLMAEILSTYRYIATRNDNVVEIVSSLNNSSLDSSVNRNICTMVVGVLDLATGHLDYCNAGHNPPVLLSGTGPGFIPVKPNMPLFAFDNYSFSAQSVDLKPGDSLFLYTDGVTDAMNSHKNMFGQEALLSSLGRYGHRPFPKAVDALLTEIRKFAGRTPQYDDITMLCIKYKGKKIF